MEKSKISINVEGGFLFCGGWNFLKLVSVGSTFIREMRVCVCKYLCNEHRENWSLTPFSNMANVRKSTMCNNRDNSSCYTKSVPILMLIMFFFNAVRQSIM